MLNLKLFTLKERINISVIGLLMGLASFAFNYYLGYVKDMRTDLSQDIASHLTSLNAFANGRDVLPSNAGYYLITWAISGFSKNYDTIFRSGLTVLALFFAFKVWVTSWFIRRFYPAIALPNLLFISVAVNLIVSIEWTSYIFLGNISPNVIHNSTLLANMPFSIILFALSVAWAPSKSLTLKQVSILGLLVFLGTLTKPSFFLAYVVWYPLWVLFVQKRRLPNISHLIHLGFGALIIAGQFIYQYKYIKPSALEATDPSHPIFYFPFGWYKVLMYDGVNRLPINIMVSFGLPAFIFIVLRKHFTPMMLAVLSIHSVAVLIFLSIGESGYRMLHGNFSWQAVATNFLFYLVSFCELGVNWKRIGYTAKIGFILISVYYAVSSAAFYFLVLKHGIWQVSSPFNFHL